MIATLQNTLPAVRTSGSATTPFPDTASGSAPGPTPWTSSRSRAGSASAAASNARNEDRGTLRGQRDAGRVRTADPVTRRPRRRSGRACFRKRTRLLPSPGNRRSMSVGCRCDGSLCSTPCVLFLTRCAKANQRISQCQQSARMHASRSARKPRCEWVSTPSRSSQRHADPLCFVSEQAAESRLFAGFLRFAAKRSVIFEGKRPLRRVEVRCMACVHRDRRRGTSLLRKTARTCAKTRRLRVDRDASILCLLDAMHRHSQGRCSRAPNRHRARTPGRDAVQSHARKRREQTQGRTSGRAAPRSDRRTMQGYAHCRPSHLAARAAQRERTRRLRKRNGAPGGAPLPSQAAPKRDGLTPRSARRSRPGRAALPAAPDRKAAARTANPCRRRRR